MILKGSQRSGAKQLATHLLNDRDNDHVTLLEVRGFVADDLTGALQEAHAISKATKCTQFLFSLSLNPPKEAVASEQEFLDAAERAEKALGLDGQPRAIVIHEKEGRRHAHVVWSRIDADSLTAINLPHFKNRLTALSKELYLDFGWRLPDGLKTLGGKSPLNFTLDEWQQARRLKLDPREIKDAFRDAWAQSDSLAAMGNALAERGYFIAKGGCHVQHGSAPRLRAAGGRGGAGRILTGDRVRSGIQAINGQSPSRGDGKLWLPQRMAETADRVLTVLFFWLMPITHSGGF